MALADVKKTARAGYKGTAVEKADYYVRPAAETPTSNVKEIGEFLSKVSPTIEKYVEAQQAAANDLETQRLLEEYSPKQVKDFDAIFKDPQSFNKFADDYNALSLAGQQKFGVMLGKKYAAATQLAVQAKAQQENWVDLTPEEFKAKVEESAKGAYGEFIKKNPQAATLPFFTQTYSEEMDAHNHTLATNQIPQYGVKMRKEAESLVSSLTMFTAQDSKKTSQQIADEITTQLKEHRVVYGSLDVRGWAVDGILASKNKALIADVIAGRAKIAYGPNGESLLNNAESIAKLQKGLTALKTEEWDALSQENQRHNAVNSLAEHHATLAAFGKSSFDAFVARGKEMGLDEGALRAAKPWFTVRRHMQSETNRNMRSANPITLMDSSNRAMQIRLQQGDRAARTYIKQVTTPMSDQDRSAFMAMYNSKLNIENSQAYGYGMKALGEHYSVNGSGMYGKTNAMAARAKEEDEMAVHELLFSISAGTDLDMTAHGAYLSPETKERLKKVGELTGQTIEQSAYVGRVVKEYLENKEATARKARAEQKSTQIKVKVKPSPGNNNASVVEEISPYQQ